MSDHKVDVATVRRRWATADLVLKWNRTPRERRERVLAELEETARECREQDSDFASDLTAAVDVLDANDNVPLLELLAQAQADIASLLSALDPAPPKQ